MPAYVIVEVKITNPELYQEVIRGTPATVAAYGGRYLARGGVCETLSGDWHPERLVILEFASSQRVREWQASPEYAPIKVLRDRAASVNMVVLECGQLPD